YPPTDGQVQPANPQPQAPTSFGGFIVGGGAFRRPPPIGYWYLSPGVGWYFQYTDGPLLGPYPNIGPPPPRPGQYPVYPAPYCRYPGNVAPSKGRPPYPPGLSTPVNPYGGGGPYMPYTPPSFPTPPGTRPPPGN